MVKQEIKNFKKEDNGIDYMMLHQLGSLYDGDKELILEGFSKRMDTTLKNISLAKGIGNEDLLEKLKKAASRIENTRVYYINNETALEMAAIFYEGSLGHDAY